ncbi:nitroreductase family protein [Zavarzinia sp. CC-PAN008]|uniref:nitroreductase family protein n=1 Tax=Zavarzinia sp. CC-PAN008 TaxID=3243332 RepID=UPI003F749EC7
MSRFRNLRITRLVLCWLKALRWTWYYTATSGAFVRGYNKDTARAWIMREAHTIEKGLGLPNPRPFFGKGKIQHLRHYIGLSLATPENAGAIAIGHGVLRSYVDWHRGIQESNPDVEQIDRDMRGCNADGSLGGTVPLRDDYSDQDRVLYDDMVTHRRSVRNFLPGIVPRSLVEEALAVANHSPSVCNRQPWAAAIVQEPGMVRRMLGLQAGNKGFDETIHNLLVIFADSHAFVEEYELFEPFVDAGIFSGAVVNALNARNIGSCCLNLCISHKKAERINAGLGVPSQFFPVMMIAFGHPVPNCRVAMSRRLPVQTFPR